MWREMVCSWLESEEFTCLKSGIRQRYQALRRDRIATVSHLATSLTVGAVGTPIPEGRPLAI